MCLQSKDLGYYLPVLTRTTIFAFTSGRVKLAATTTFIDVGVWLPTTTTLILPGIELTIITTQHSLTWGYGYQQQQH